MESRIRLLLLSCLVVACSGCSVMPWHHRSQPPVKSDSSGAAASSTPVSSTVSDQPPPSVVEPTVQRRKVTVPKIGARNVELGAYYGEISIQNFGSQPVAGVRADYHITEDFFFEGAYGRAKGGKTSFEYLSGGIQLLSDAERRFTYYNLSLGYNLLPGEVFIGRNTAMASALYMIGGIGSIDFAGSTNFAVNFGAGFRVLPVDYLALHIDVQDLVYKSTIIGINQLENNLQATIGLSFFF